MKKTRFRKTALWKDIWKCIAKTQGRFLSIVCLIALGSFALVGLQISGPDMRKTGENYFNRQRLPDISVISDFGIDKADVAKINEVPGLSRVEYGYLKDVVLDGTNKSIRVFSETKELSQVQVTEGRLPRTDGEIALATLCRGNYHMGDTLQLDEKPDRSGSLALKQHIFKLVGFVDSPEIINKVNMGASTAGTGSLEGYAIVTPGAFDSDVYMIARLAFDDTKGLDPYSKAYTNKLQAHKKALQALLADEPEHRLTEVKQEYQKKIDEANQKITDAKKKLEDAHQTLLTKEADLKRGQEQYQSGLSTYEANKAEAASRLQSAAAQLASGRAQVEALSDPSARRLAEDVWGEGNDAYLIQRGMVQSGLEAAHEKLEQAKQDLADGAVKLQQGWSDYHAAQKDVNAKISEAQTKIQEAHEKLDALKPPVYVLDSRREVPGAEGYRIYSAVADIVDSLADIFPIFLYFVAALVTLTTMTRFVDEERINSGTLKALGYGKRDILKKYTLYGFLTSTIGAVIGITAGHTLLPYIVYNAYGEHFTLPPIELHFYPWISLGALVLAYLCAVFPAFLVAEKELREKPSALLLPKPPEKGSKILLERITPIWKRLSFTHKVTARNLFRYKKRMLMTIFGVCGAVTLIFAGFSVQHSISGIKDRQFKEIMKFDLIVSQNEGLSTTEKSDIAALLRNPKIARNLPIHFETMTKIAGRNEDKQEIDLLVPEQAADLTSYITLENRSSGKSLALDNQGALISERLAKLLDADPGDEVTLNDAAGTPRKIRISGITEMYMGHYIFLSRPYYEQVFGQSYTPNAYLLTLHDRSVPSAQAMAQQFIDLSGVKGVVQNTTFITEIDTITRSLNQIMEILIIVAIMLAAVILYNLTNINVSERIRELSTIKVLGFYNLEVTRYIYRETIILTLLGILAGFGFGDVLYLYIIKIVPPENCMFDPALGVAAFVIPVIVVVGITAILGLLVNRRLRRLDMLQALKSVE